LRILAGVVVGIVVGDVCWGRSRSHRWGSLVGLQWRSLLGGVAWVVAKNVTGEFAGVEVDIAVGDSCWGRSGNRRWGCLLGS
jgi:hypothetical protein